MEQDGLAGSALDFIQDVWFESPIPAKPQIVQKSRYRLKILGARRVTWSKFCINDPQMLGATVQKLVAGATSTRDLYTSVPTASFHIHSDSLFTSI